MLKSRSQGQLHFPYDSFNPVIYLRQSFKLASMSVPRMSNNYYSKYDSKKRKKKQMADRD